MSTPPSRTFTIHACLGRGGFGEVYRADMKRPGGLDTEVAIKVLRRDVGMHSQAVQRLRDEGKLLAKLTHPAILRVHDLLVLEGRVALVTEFVDGEDLSECFDGDPPIPMRALLEVISQVAGALHVAWTAPVGADGRALRLVHRDIKPSNIRIGQRGVVKLLDFGIARTDEVTREAKTMTDMLVGSPPYMAPERFLDAQVLPASDIFALGASLAEGLMGRRMFDVPVTLLAGLAVDDDRYDRFVADKLAPLDASTPPGVVALLRRLLAHDPNARPSAEQLSREAELLADEIGGVSLRAWARQRRWGAPPTDRGELDGRQLTEGSLERPTISAAPEPAPHTLTSPPSSRWGWWMGGASLVAIASSAAFVLVSAAVVVLALWRPWESEPAPAPNRIEEPAPVAAPEPERPALPPAAPAPAAPPAPSRVEPKVAPKPDDTPLAAPKPAPEEAPAAVARVSLAPGSTAARLERGGARVSLPADVPAGAWRVEGQFRDQWTPTELRIQVESGGQYVVSCSDAMWNCTVR